MDGARRSDLAGNNFHNSGRHNYEYEPDNFESELLRPPDYRSKLCGHVRRRSILTSKLPSWDIEPAASRTNGVRDCTRQAPFQDGNFDVRVLRGPHVVAQLR